MDYYIDTNVMWRRFASDDPMHQISLFALDSLLVRGDTLNISAQNLIEFQAIATRPLEVNGLGLTTRLASEKALEMTDMFSFLPDTPDIYSHWRRLVDVHEVKGKQVHDARIVAVMLSHNIGHIVTFNHEHFSRFTEITVITPENIT